MRSEIPDKLYFKIGEVSKLADVAPHVIRYWESEFSAITPKRANSNQRLYRREDVELILTIKTLLHHKGYTIAGARKLIADDNYHHVYDISSKTNDNSAQRLKKIKLKVLELYDILKNT